MPTPSPPQSADPTWLLAAASPQLETLLPDPTRQRLVRQLQRLGLPTQVLCLECRLGAQDARVDVALCLFPSLDTDLGRALDGLGQQRSQAPAWEHAWQLLSRWAQRDEPALANVPLICVAFDLENESLTLPTPCLSFCVDPELALRQLGFPLPRRAEPERVQELTEFIHAGLCGEALPEACAARLGACLALDGVEARHVSLMLGRSPVPLKLDLALPVRELSSFLRRHDFPADAAEIQAQVAELVPWQRKVQLNYTLHPALSPYLEVELCTGPEADDLARRGALLEQLTRRGLIGSEKARALMALLQDTVSLDDGAMRVACNWYLKLRFEGDSATAAKGYIGLMPRRALSRRRIQHRSAAPDA